MRKSNTRAMGLVAMGAALFCAPGPAAEACAAVDVAPMVGLMFSGVRDLDTLAALAVASDARVARDARDLLRAAGPAGLAAFRALHREELARAVATDLSPGTAASEAVQAALDHICAQKDCAASQLYWYTDLAAAKAAARASGRPIVSLRLLGDLREELSCANSRFFRALLYPDPAVSAALRERFVLHWQTERPAPKISIELGDGRRVETTITGNSAHYLLDSDGHPVDVLPGLMEPRQFLAALQASEMVARRLAAVSDPRERAAALRDHHIGLRAAQERAFSTELAQVGEPARSFTPPPRPGVAAPRPVEPTRAVRAPRAGQAAMLAASKSGGEAMMLRMVGEPVERLSNDELWTLLGDRRAAQVELSPASLAMIGRQQWRSGDPNQDAADLALALVALRRSVAVDGLFNEFELHRRVHEWFIADGPDAHDLEALDRWVYADLFLTPGSDPWLGLAAPTIYTGLAGGGRRARI